jgi:hypothetical protein
VVGWEDSSYDGDLRLRAVGLLYKIMYSMSFIFNRFLAFIFIFAVSNLDILMASA